MEQGAPSTSARGRGVETRHSRRLAEQRERQLTANTRGANVLSSPQLDSFYSSYQPPRKVARLTNPAKSDTIRHIREKGYNGEKPALTGLLGSIASETLQQILGYCNAKELGALEATCSYFIKTGITDKVAKHFLKDIPRAKGLKPDIRKGETYVTLLAFVQGQSIAAAQGTAVALGTYHTVGLLHNHIDPSCPEYALFGMGRGFHGQLGNGDYDNRDAPQRVDIVDRDIDRTDKPAPTKLYQGLPDDIQLAVVSAGSSHSASISRRGELYTWGLASSGELGHGGWTPIEVSVPRMIPTLGRTRIVSVCAGSNHTLAISEIGQLWSCGRGRHGQLGLGHFHDEGILSLVEHIRHERVVSAAAGKAHSIALASDGKIFTWGDAKYGQLGHAQLAPMMNGVNGAPVAIPVPQAISELEPARLRPPARVTAIAAGGDHSMAVTVGGTLLAFGCNKHGQLGMGDTVDRMSPVEVPLRFDGDSKRPVRAMQVACGIHHTIALVQNDGRFEVRTAGDNSYGQLGLGDRKERQRFFPITSLQKSHVVCVCAGDWHNAVVSEQGELYMWGRGDCGQLGHGDDKSQWRPKKLEDFVVIHPDRTLRRNRKPPLKTLLLPAEQNEKKSVELATRSARGRGRRSVAKAN